MPFRLWQVRKRRHQPPACQEQCLNLLLCGSFGQINQRRIGAIVTASPVGSMTGTALLLVKLFTRDHRATCQRLALHQRRVNRNLFGWNIQHSLRVSGCSAPLPATIGAGKENGHLSGNGSVGATRLCPTQHPNQRILICYPVIKIGHRKLLTAKGLGQTRNGLRWAGLFFGNGTRRERLLINGKQWFSRRPVEHKNMPLFGNLSHCIDPLAPMSHGQQGGRGGWVAVPNVVVNQLVMPEPLASRGIKGQ